MRRFWHTWLALVASVSMVGVANGQGDWSQPSEIGSYQSILSRAGYGDGTSAGMSGNMGGTPIAGQRRLQHLQHERRTSYGWRTGHGRRAGHGRRPQVMAGGQVVNGGQMMDGGHVVNGGHDGWRPVS